MIINIFEKLTEMILFIEDMQIIIGLVIVFVILRILLVFIGIVKYD